MAKYIYLENVQISWGVSRGRDTYGYNICRAYSPHLNKTFRTCGGGYDMQGTVIGQFIAEAFQQELQALKIESIPYAQTGHFKHPELYGLFFRANGTAYCDGACGIESMLRIVQALGLEYQRTYNKKGHTTGYIFSKLEA